MRRGAASDSAFAFREVVLSRVSLKGVTRAISHYGRPHVRAPIIWERMAPPRVVGAIRVITEETEARNACHAANITTHLIQGESNRAM
jgi:hypothetical protein